MGGSSAFIDHADAISSTVMETDPSGAVLWDVVNGPWGQVWQQTGTRQSQVFAGMDWQVNDPLMPSATREYSDGLGRWMTPDPGGVKVVSLNNPQTWNMYAYVTDNPTTLNDPSGLHGECSAEVANSHGGCTAADPNNVQDPTLVDHGSAKGVNSAQKERRRPSLEEIRAAWTAYLKWTSGNKAWLAANHPTINSILDNLEFVAAFSDLGGEDPEAMLGSEGAQFGSKTLWTEGDARIDVENPAPGRRPGMIHYQNGPRGSTQYIFDIKSGSFRGLTQAENEDLLSNPKVQAAIQKGLRYLGVR